MSIIREETGNARQLAYLTLETATDAIFWVDSEARIQRVNWATGRSLGYTRDELLSMTIADFNPDLFRDWPAFWERAKQEKAFVLSSQHSTKDGRVFPVESIINHIDFDGKEYVCFFARDISHRASTHEEPPRRTTLFEALFHAEGDAILFSDPEHRIVLANQSAAMMFGYDPDELTGQRTLVLYASAQEFLRQGSIRFNLSAEEKLKPYKTHYKRKNGEHFRGETVESTIYGEQGDVLGSRLVIRDVTGREEQDESLRHTPDEARTAPEQPREHDDGLPRAPAFLPEHNAAFPTLREVEQQLIRQALEATNWIIEGKRGAAIRLGMPPSTLRDRMKKYGFKRPSR
ncbi:MAG: PAS domain S-box protein [Rhodothermales bacterium]